MTRASDALEQGRASFARRAWRDAYVQLSTADREIQLGAADLERLAYAAHLSGGDTVSEAVLARAHRAFLDCGDREGGARCAFWLAYTLLNKGDMARGGGWIARAQRVLDEGPRECIVHGYLLVPAAIRCVVNGDAETAHRLFCDAADIGQRLHDTDLVTLALHGRGRALIRLGKTAEGVALLDEAMVAVTADEVSPMVAGDIYCSVIEACHEIFDLRRAHEWTSALTAWCASQPDLVPFRGQCLVRRAEILQFHGAWADAMAEARRACERLAQPPQRAIGAALYQRAELLRLRGEVAQADETYREAGQHGRNPQPGLSLLRLSQGQIDAAAAAIRTALDESNDRRLRSRILGAYIEIMLAANDAAAARAGAEELSAIASALDAPFLRAVAGHVRGAVLLAEDDPRAALVALHGALGTWSELEAPYEAARTRVLIAVACRQLGDTDGADIELEAARRVFTQLGAAPELARVEELLPRTPAPAAAGGLSAREVEVLRLLATGKTNRAIAADLCISEKTVARHVSNIFNKLSLSTRAAATAYAYKRHLV